MPGWRRTEKFFRSPLNDTCIIENFEFVNSNFINLELFFIVSHLNRNKTRIEC